MSLFIQLFCRKLFFASTFFILLIGTPNLFFKAKAETAKQIMCTNYNNVNLRNGPGVKFPLAFKLMQKDYPLLILESFENWYAVTDFNGDKFWVSSANLTRKCGGIVKLNVSPPVKIKPNKNSVTLFTLQEGFVIKNIKCYEKWCNIKIEDKSGWVEKQFIWGV